MLVESGRGVMFGKASNEKLEGALGATDYGEAVSLCVPGFPLVVLVVDAIDRDLARDDAEPGAFRDRLKACSEEPLRVGLDSGQQDGRQFGGGLQNVSKRQPACEKVRGRGEGSRGWLSLKPRGEEGGAGVGGLGRRRRRRRRACGSCSGGRRGIIVCGGSRCCSSTTATAVHSLGFLHG
jgi:hypothetical protein